MGLPARRPTSGRSKRAKLRRIMARGGNDSGGRMAVWRDTLYALRTMRQNPAFAVTAIFTLALGIGANTAMFTVIHAVLLKPLEYRDPDRLVRISGGATSVRFSQIRSAARSFTDVGAFTVLTENMSLSSGDAPEALKAARVSANFLRILGVDPTVGRSFLPDEDTPGSPPVAMISAELWRRRFGRDSRISGKTATLAAVPYTIIGVLPDGFQFPFAGVDVWVTKPSEWSVLPPKAHLLSPILNVFGRLKPRVDGRQATAELALINQQYAAAHPGMLDSKPGSTEQVRPLKDQLVANVRPMLWMLFGAVGLVLL